MYCVHCGAETRPLDKFCRKCGEKQSEATPVPSVSTESQAPTPSVSAEPQAPTQPQDIPAIRELFRSNETPPSRPNAALVGSAALVGVLIFGAGVYWYMSQRQAAIVSEGAPTTTSDVAMTTAEDVATTTAEDVAMTTAALILATAQLATVPTSADYTARSWTDLEYLLPSRSWSDLQGDLDYPHARRAEVAEGMIVEAKGSLTMILQATITRLYTYDELDMMSAFESVFSPTDLRCEFNGAASFGERWYRVSREGMKPVTAVYEWSGGSGGTSEWFTFGQMELPAIGTDGVGGGIWMDVCSN